MKYQHLNQYVGQDAGYTPAWSRVLERLGDYTALIIQSLQLRPDAVVLLEQTTQYLLVRATAQNRHVVLRIAPEADLTGLVFFGRAMAQHQLPAAQIMQYDLGRVMVPFAYTVESYVCGLPAAQLEASDKLRQAARQAGRALRRMHRVAAPGWGRPKSVGRWPSPDWPTVLAGLHEMLSFPPYDELVFNEDERAAVAELLASLPPLASGPVLTHGAMGPQAVRCTMGEYVQLEALVEPGAVLGGDGLFDLALGLNPAYPQAWCDGLLEGYASQSPLTAAERERLNRFYPLVCYWAACGLYARGEPHEVPQQALRQLLVNHV
ncbi:MAG: phosphotransferase [Chloroflexaceae bacterium]|jgi:Ser/Thr protein kinase RdoA (MazF antagonist)|nr:phosphotransferase [Chloroflexaceae bacterium]